MQKFKLCKKCGAQMDKSAKACPQCGAPCKGKGWLIAVVVVVVLIAVTGAAGNSKKTKDSDSPTLVSQSEKEQTSEKNSAEENDDTSKASQTASDNSSSESAQSENAEETPNNIFHVGDTISMENASVTFKSADDYTSDNQFMQPEEGNKYICAYFIIENNGSSDMLTGTFDFNCYADNAKANSKYFTDKALSSDTLSPGRKMEGYVWFEVPINAEKIEIEYEPNSWKQDKAIFIVKE